MRASKLLLAAGVALHLLWSATTATAEEFPNSHCFRCHRLPTLGYHDPERNRLVNLAVDPVKYPGADHGKLACTKCHTGDFSLYPHNDAPVTAAARCQDCHSDPERLKNLRFATVTVQFGKSVHARLRDFTCFSCHDPHTGSIAPAASTREGVARANSTCTECHTPPDPRAEKTAVPHEWLPNVTRHFAAVRCVDCHTPNEEEAIHAILPAERAQRECVQCHTSDSLLLAKLYRHQVVEERQRAGFVNSVVMNDAYIIGMTRNRWLDWGSGALAVLTVLTLAGHGLARWIATRRRRSHHE